MSISCIAKMSCIGWKGPNKLLVHTETVQKYEKVLVCPVLTWCVIERDGDG